MIYDYIVPISRVKPYLFYLLGRIFHIRLIGSRGGEILGLKES